jgi:hypothetical protein
MKLKVTLRKCHASGYRKRNQQGQSPEASISATLRTNRADDRIANGTSYLRVPRM